MDEKEYLQTLGEQIVNPHARASILAEIQDHIEEQAQDYRASGMSEAVAMQEALKDIFGPMFEAMLQGEMNSHLGYPNNGRGEKETVNRRNGYSKKL